MYKPAFIFILKDPKKIQIDHSSDKKKKKARNIL